MTGGNITDGVSKPRQALGDLTNQSLKRGFSSIYGDSGLKSVEGVESFENSGFAKQVCLGVENLVREKCKSGFKTTGDGKGKGVLLLKKDGQIHDSDPVSSEIGIGDGVDNVASLLSDGHPTETKEASNLLDGSVDVVEKGVGEIGDGSRDSCGSSRTDSDDDVRVSYNVSLSQSVAEEFAGSQGLTSESRDPGVDDLDGEKAELHESSMLLSSQNSKSFQLDRCTRFEESSGGACANAELGADFLKTCSCSFCLTAAFMWSDLHYQDIKGRLSSLKKSQKEASILVNKFSRGRQAEVPNQGSASNSLQFETDLTWQWRSLFQHMEDIFAHESCQIEKNFLALKDLRESCKMDLVKTNGVPPDHR
ncbi:unnamed protein product [Linum tenue]|uniref:Uncharacterized protein n=1 Tax=Linum tenue TaxID=586396 RepID=A0AAV0L471_9ROSI|nr:unnamed protein product [Linum tenue]